MIPLVDKVNVDPASADYPFGDLNDDNGTGNGTPANRELFTDIIQTAEKIMFESGITPNGLPDNDYSGFQLFEAMVKIFGRKKTIQSSWNMDTNPNLTITHGVNPFTKIRAVNVMVLSNNGLILASLLADGGVGAIDATDIVLSRTNAGSFDSAAYNNATIYTTINYED